MALLCSIGDLAISLTEPAPEVEPVTYSRLFGVDLADPMEADTDEDGDGLSTSEEAALGTDPFERDSDLDGWEDGYDDDPLSRVVIYWGSPPYTSGDA